MQGKNELFNCYFNERIVLFCKQLKINVFIWFVTVSQEST